VKFTKLTTDIDFLDGMKSLAFDAAKRYTRDPRASLTDLVELHPHAATVRLRLSSGENVGVVVSFTGTCSTIPSELLAEDDLEDTLVLDAAQLDAPVPYSLSERARAVFAERGQF
jgi:hypothetical protein